MLPPQPQFAILYRARMILMRLIIVTIILIASVLLEAIFVGHMSIFGVTPYLMLPIITSYSILRGDTEGAIVGFTGGLLQDIVLGQALGLFAMLGLLVGYFAGKPFRDFFRESYLLPMLITGVIATIYGFTVYIFNSLTIAPINMFHHIGTVILPATVYTMIISLIVYRIIYAINALLEFFERRRRKIFER